MKRWLILFLITACFIIEASGQSSDQKLLFYHFSEKDGLADNAVNCFYQDTRGVMWMGTDNGLSCFDGSEISTWRNSKSSPDNHLLSNQVNWIAQGKGNILWLATSNGLSSVDIITKKISAWPYKGDNWMHTLVVDDNKIWIATNSGLLLFDITQKKFTRFENNTPTPSPGIHSYNNYCNSLFLDSKKRLWLATVNGLWLFNTGKETFEQYDSERNDALFDGMVNTIFEDHSGTIWFGCWSRGLKQVIPESHTIKNFNNIKGLPSHIMTIAEQRTGDNRYLLWLSDFLTEFDPTTSKAEQHDLKPIAEAATLDPRCIYISRDSLLWISTVKGVYILDPARQLFKHYFVGGHENITRQNPALFDLNGNVLIGGDKDFTLKLFDDKLNLTKDFTPSIRALKGDYTNAGFAVINITQFDKRTLLLSSSAGILKFDTKTGGINIVCKSVTDSLNRNSGFINNVFINKGVTWCFPWRRGVWQFDSISNKFRPIISKLPDAYGAPKNLNFQDAVSDGKGNIWITDLDYGIVKYTPKTKKFTRFLNKDITAYSRVINERYLNGQIWLIANTTVVALNPLTERTRSWPMPDGMNKFIYEYTNDDDGNLWIASKTGLIVFNTTNHSFNQYTEEDGLINNDMDGAIRKLSSGEMIYAGENYITKFRPHELLRLPKKKKLLLTGLLADDAELKNSTAGKVSIPPSTEKVTFKWALLNYANPLQNRYYNKLDKIDNEWNYAGNKGKVEYNNLPPGDYKFRYKAITADGLTGDEKVLSFTIEPTPWQTWWFRATIFVLIIICVLFIIRDTRIKEQKKSALQLQLSNLEMKALRAQMNPHFIFNALNSIQECIITKNTDTAYSYLSSFSKLVRMILENSEKQFITLAEEIETLQLYLSIEKLRFDGAFEFQLKIDTEVEPLLIHLPAMIIQPFVENALWHGLIHKKGDKKLSISFEQKKNNLICLISDNGIGRALSRELKTNNQIKRNSMGISITEERLHLLEAGARINIEDLSDANGNASGTKVTILIPMPF